MLKQVRSPCASSNPAHPRLRGQAPAPEQNQPRRLTGVRREQPTGLKAGDAPRVPRDLAQQQGRTETEPVGAEELAKRYQLSVKLYAQNEMEIGLR